jgi:hypothetical protein
MIVGLYPENKDKQTFVVPNDFVATVFKPVFFLSIVTFNIILIGYRKRFFSACQQVYGYIPVQKWQF